VTQDDLTAKQLDYAVFLPAISGFYATFVGKQRDPANGSYVDPARFPRGLTDMEQMKQDKKDLLAQETNVKRANAQKIKPAQVA
jgi:hypothetical protein